MSKRAYYDVTCLVCDYSVTVYDDELRTFILSAPACPHCRQRVGWHVGDLREYEGPSPFDEEDETEFVPHPIPFTEKAIKKELDSCMGELHLWLESDEGKAACERAKYDPKGPWGQEGSEGGGNG